MLYSQSPPLTADEPSSGGLAYDPGVRSDQRVGRRRMKASTDSAHHYRFGDGPLPSGRPSLGRRLFRALTRFSIAVLIGVGATLGWQSYGDEAREMLVARAPALGWVLPVPTTRPPGVAAISIDSRQLVSLASTLEAVRRSVDQLAAKQEQMSQNIAALRAVEDDVRQKMSSAPPAPAPAQQAAAPLPQPKPPQAKIDSRLPTSAGSQFSR